MLLNAEKCQGDSFYCFCAIKVKPTEGKGGGESPSPPSRIGLRGSIMAEYLASVQFYF